MQFRYTFYTMRAISAQFGLHSGNMNFNTRKEWISIIATVHIIVIVCFFLQNVHWKVDWW